MECCSLNLFVCKVDRDIHDFFKVVLIVRSVIYVFIDNFLYKNKLCCIMCSKHSEKSGFDLQYYIGKMRCCTIEYENSIIPLKSSVDFFKSDYERRKSQLSSDYMTEIDIILSKIDAYSKEPFVYCTLADLLSFYIETLKGWN